MFCRLASCLRDAGGCVRHKDWNLREAVLQYRIIYRE